MHKSYIALGSNVGNSQENVLQAIERLGALGRVVSASSLYLTKPWGLLDQPDFVNAVVQIETEFSPQELLAAILEIEQTMGRERIVRWGPRTIDLDILTFDDLAINEPNLEIPHPRMGERAFVLVPLAEIDPAYAESLSLLDADALSQVVRLEGPQNAY